MVSFISRNSSSVVCRHTHLVVSSFQHQFPSNLHVSFGHLLFLIYINDNELDDNITSNVLKFADDIKVLTMMVINNIYKMI